MGVERVRASWQTRLLEHVFRENQANVTSRVPARSRVTPMPRARRLVGARPVDGVWMLTSAADCAFTSTCRERHDRVPLGGMGEVIR